MIHSTGRIKLINAESQDQLRLCIENLAIDVPLRGQGRTSDDCEQWQVQRLLQTLFRTGELQSPVSLTKRESPDFLLTTTHAMGIEATEAINPDYIAATMHPHASNPKSVVDPSMFKWSTRGRRTRKQIRDEAARTELTGDGWPGDSPEREFATIIADTVMAKHTKLIDGYERFDSDNLLIYQNQTLPCLDVECARHHAEHKVASLLHPPGFHRVFVDDGERILEFTAAGSRVL